MCSCHLTKEDAEQIGESVAKILKIIFEWINSKFEKKKDFKKKTEGNVEVYEYDPQFKNLRLRRHSD